ncbi:uncharacterized protein LOC127844792 isoform X3 [Dreissena polymorpha]|uniref:uncharacterized protein LOC127844792 isoform X3 n=1 Tax=Dreissena polymorpha TaxID=45954 RepID=UPI002264B22B|nr:uncharacterized protein LOC127844792 isoform X3 [Dreissena polymorpha]
MMLSPVTDNESVSSKKEPKAPVIQVTQILHPNDDRHNTPPSSHRKSVPTIGTDNPVFVTEDEINCHDSDQLMTNELIDLHTPLPSVPYLSNKGGNSNVFSFDPDALSLFSRRGSLSIESTVTGLQPDTYPRRGSYGPANSNNSLTVPSLRKNRNLDASEGKVLHPGILDTGGSSAPLPSPGQISMTSAWSEVVLNNSRRSSDAALSEISRVSNVSSSLSDYLRHLVRAFSSRTERVKESTMQPPSPSSLSDCANSDALSAISAEPQFRHRLDSFFPGEVDGDTFSEIERFREEQESDKTKKYTFPRWLRKLRFPHVIEPQSKLYLFWLFIVTCAFLYNAWVIPLRAAFPYQTDDNIMYWLIADYTCDVIYIIDIILFKSRISFLNSGLKETHRSKTRANYFQKLMFKFDVASLLPLDLLYLIQMKVNPWCRLPRLLKIQTFWEFYSRCDHLVRSAHAVRIIKTFTYMLFLIHVETCGYYAISEYEGFDSNRWVYNGKGIAYIRCFYLATKTATSIGNNPKPTNTLEFSFMTVYWVSGVFVFALLIGQIRDIVDAANMVKRTYTKRMDAALNYVKNMNLPKETQDRVRTWFIYNWQQQKVIDERQMMNALPMKLRKDLAIHVHFNTLSKVKLFSDCDKTLLYDLVLKLKPILYLPGDYVCKKGEIGKEMYIVSQGIVEVVGGPNNALVLATLREGSVFGEISLLAMAAEGNRRTADVRCKGYTNLFILLKADFEAAMKDYPDAHKLLKKRAKKLLRINARIERQSQSSMDNTKINATNIIRSPPGTPKLLKTVIKIMDPDSTLVRKLSSRRHSVKAAAGGTDDVAKTQSGNDNKAFEHSVDQTRSTDGPPDAVDLAEAFYDDFLSNNDWSREQLESALEARNQTEAFDGGIISNGAKSSKTTYSGTTAESADSVDQDTEERQLDEFESDIIDVSPTLDGYNYSVQYSSSPPDEEEAKCSFGGAKCKTITSDMFGDIQSTTEARSNASSVSQQSDRKEPAATARKGCLSRNLRDDEYAQSLANGFTIIIDSVDDIGTDVDCCFTGGKHSAKPEVEPEKMEVKIAKNVSFREDDFKANGIDTAESDKSNKMSESNKVEKTLAPSSASMYKHNSKRLPIKPASAGKAKQSKTKLDSNIKVHPEKIVQNSPYGKSSQIKKGKTPKAKLQNSKAETIKKKLPNGDPISSDSTEYTQRLNWEERETRTNKTDDEASSFELIHVESVSAMPMASAVRDSVQHHSDDHHITCVADIHREKTLSPRDDLDDRSSLTPERVAQRQRKISVISIGSVLKDGRDTLV